VISCVGDEPSSGTTETPIEASIEAPPDARTEAAPDAGGSPDADAAIEAGVDAGSAYANAVLADKPLAFLRLGETAGQQANDEQGLYNGTISPAGVTLGVTGVTNDGNRAVTLAGTGCIDLNDVLDFANSTYSIEVWVKPDALASAGLVTKYAAANGYGLSMKADGKVLLGTGMEGIESTAVLSTTAATHVVAVWGAGTGQIYFNGQPAGNGSAMLKPPDTAGHLGLGCFFNAGDNAPINVFKGLLDDVALYDKALTASQAATHFAAAKK
jgi:hypothetical protein